MKTNRLVLASFFLSSVFCPLTSLFSQGALTPPGAPAATMKTLDQIEPRTPISALPFFITTAGSYYVTRSITVSGATLGIVIQSDDVTIDLNGFTLTGGPSGAINGIDVPSQQKNLYIRNGTIRGWTNAGVGASLTANCRFENLIISNSGGSGLLGGSSSVISGCVAFSNLSTGISATTSTISNCTAKSNNTGFNGSDCTFRDCTADSNSGIGHFPFRGTVIGCSATANQTGFFSGGATQFTDSIAAGNTNFGFVLSTGGQIENCVAGNNGITGILANGGVNPAIVRHCKSDQNGLHGINVQGDSVAIGNHCIGNGTNSAAGAGVRANGARNVVDGNIVQGNDIGIQVFSGSTQNVVIHNIATNNPVNNYDIAVDNKVGPIFAAPNSLAITGNTGGAGMGGTDPWANFSY